MFQIELENLRVRVPSSPQIRRILIDYSPLGKPQFITVVGWGDHVWRLDSSGQEIGLRYPGIEITPLSPPSRRRNAPQTMVTLSPE